ncbi:DRTGG domain-containing protein [Paenibacillus filicis]|uniref:DRTGG domain-containing protein n=1 Tax=Paenibacillus gyeongsangnamensis TaxID=3388067 RepID=A0ABT4Q993_9BACL|nr:DRTGG domain-containing protein [Paenibacillus filicis]MCZ8513432.1 DRTGG domain-containing protein [Paenibacillus filicis]
MDQEEDQVALPEAATKHEQIIKYIESLKIGSKISVRKLAEKLEVSEGTAYRAMKEADTLGLVATKERVGTVRVEKKLRDQLDKLTFAEVVNMVDGDVLGGRTGLDKTLHKFVIGAMQQDAMMRYIDPGSLLIVGNRSKAHLCAIEQGAGVLITGGFGTSEDVKELADRLELPIISSSYDTFTVASMINRAIYDRLIKKKILLIGDIVPKPMQVYVLKASHTMKDWQRLHDETGHSRFPVVDEWNRVIGMITSKDLIGAGPDQTIDKIMTRGPVTASLSTSIASAAHLMVWEGIELLPIIDNNRKVTAVISRKDVLKAMQQIQRQPQHGETFEDLIWSGFSEARDASSGQLVFKGAVTPQMTNRFGTVSEGVLTVLMRQAAYQAVEDVKKGDLVLDNMSSYFVKPVQIDSTIEIRPKLIEVSRKFGKIDVEVFHGTALVAKAMLTAQVIEQA